MERIKAKFTFNDLKDSSRYYFPIMDRLDNKTDVGSDFSVIFDTIMIYNRAFIKLLSDAEMYAVYALVRLQLDNLIYLYAEYEHPSKVLNAVFSKGRTLNQITIDGSQLNPSEIRRKIDEEYCASIRELYKKFSGYIHPSKLQADIPTDFYCDGEKCFYTTTQQRKYSRDMIEINNLLGKVALSIYKNKIKETN